MGHQVAANITATNMQTFEGIAPRHACYDIWRQYARPRVLWHHHVSEGRDLDSFITTGGNHLKASRRPLPLPFGKDGKSIWFHAQHLNINTIE